MIKYVIPFITSFISTTILIIVCIYVGRRVSFSNRRSIRHIHAKNTVRLGGIALILGFNLSLLINPDIVITSQLIGVMIASLVILVIGTWDDFKELFWKNQLFYQVAIAVLVFIMGIRIYYITNPLTGGIINLDAGPGVFISMILVLIWIVLIINTLNWLDGIDGLSDGITFICMLTIFALSLKPEVNQPPMAILAIIMAGTTLSFLIFNYNPARILAGTAGSMFMGFMLSVTAIFAGTKIATALLVLAIPVIDFVWVIIDRWRKKKSIFRPDSNHLHYKLLKLGWSQRQINFYFFAVTILIALIALNTRVIGKSITLAATVLIITVMLFFIDKKIKRLEKNEK
jgi:UDP-GlcNAc:undecaprenyl-phosphate GlcNAc-1-phosphate transferase